MFYAKKTSIEDLTNFIITNTPIDKKELDEEEKEKAAANPLHYYLSHYDNIIPRNYIGQTPNPDYNGIVFDLENVMSPKDIAEDIMNPVRQIGDYAVVMCAGGGDWEGLVYFALYLGEDDKLHLYIPTEGNTYNPISMTAFGSEFDGKHVEDMRKFGKENGFDIDEYEGFPPFDDEFEWMPEAMIELIKANSTPNEEKMFKNIEENIAVR